MSLPRKKSRSIVVDGVEYRWRVNEVDLGGGPETALYVELAQGPASLLSFRFYGTKAVTPAIVELAIRLGTENGWEPTVRMPKIFDLTQAAGVLKAFSSSSIVKRMKRSRTLHRRRAPD